MQGYCADETACATSSECERYLLCWIGCQGRDDCEEACDVADDAGTGPRYLGPDYTFGTCTTACGLGMNWECLLYWEFPISTASVSLDTAVYPPAFLAQLASEFQVSLDPDRGHIDALVFDCLRYLGAGVQVTCAQCDSETVQAYTQQSGPPSRTATATDATGGVLFANVPVGVVDLVATPVGLAQRSAHVTVNVTAGAITVVQLPPMP